MYKFKLYKFLCPFYSYFLNTSKSKKLSPNLPVPFTNAGKKPYLIEFSGKYIYTKRKSLSC
ncbi:hypothetical protein GCM10011405_00560 [Rufibacter glacialis]|nr:hypothetical protein GCM10011405_00560 [Rufibacter glacialis]